jgi:hypothetical protein
VPFYVNVNHENGNVVNNWIDSLGAFFPGLLTLSARDTNQYIAAIY